MDTKIIQHLCEGNGLGCWHWSSQNRWQTTRSKKRVDTPLPQLHGPLQPPRTAAEIRPRKRRNFGNLLKTNKRNGSHCNATRRRLFCVCSQKEREKCKHAADRKMVGSLDAVPWKDRQWGHFAARNMINRNKNWVLRFWTKINTFT